MTLSGTTSGQSGPDSNGSEGVLNIPQSSRPEASSSDGLASYQGHSLKGVLPLCSQYILQSQPSRLLSFGSTKLI